MVKKSIIIPNIENIPNAEVMIMELEKHESHALGVIEFSNTYNLGITYESIGLDSLSYCSEKWYQEVARLGHVFLRLEEELSIIYLPVNVSLNQYEWFKDNKEELDHELVNFGLQVIDSNGHILVSESPKYSLEYDCLLFKMLYNILEEQTKEIRKSSSR